MKENIANTCFSIDNNDKKNSCRQAGIDISVILFASGLNDWLAICQR
jgi:hypothetical protein